MLWTLCMLCCSMNIGHYWMSPVYHTWYITQLSEYDPLRCITPPLTTHYWVVVREIQDHGSPYKLPPALMQTCIHTCVVLAHTFYQFTYDKQGFLQLYDQIIERIFWRLHEMPRQILTSIILQLSITKVFCCYHSIMLCAVGWIVVPMAYIWAYIWDISQPKFTLSVPSSWLNIFSLFSIPFRKFLHPNNVSLSLELWTTCLTVRLQTHGGKLVGTISVFYCILGTV